MMSKQQRWNHLPAFKAKVALVDQGQRTAPTTDERERIKALEREVCKLRQANEILRKACAYSAMAELDCRAQT